MLEIFSYKSKLFYRNYCDKALTCNDFRGIAMSSLLSKVYESCIYNRFQYFFRISNNQFGFKKRSGWWMQSYYSYPAQCGQSRY